MAHRDPRIPPVRTATTQAARPGPSSRRRPPDAATTSRALQPTLPVLIVDDDPSTRQLLTLTLQRAGFETIQAESGEDALRAIEAQAIGLVVCDLNMPGMSGIEVVESLRSRAETATMPIILLTGSGNHRSVIEGLDAGADDFLSKPVRLDELMARVRAHLRTHTAWSSVLQDEFAIRSGVVAALGSLALSGVPEEAAEAVVRELAARTGSDFVSVALVDEHGGMQELATFNRVDGVQRGGERFSAGLAGYLLKRMGAGPWVDEVRPGGATESSAALQTAGLDLVADAPIYAGEELVGLLSIGIKAGDARSARSRHAKLLASAIDYASVLSAIAGPAIAGLRQRSARRSALQAILDDRAFHSVFQPVVDLQTLETVGFEALTRFDDGVPPLVQFADALRAEMGPAFELAAIAMAIELGEGLPAGAFLSVNISPKSLIDRAAEVKAILDRAPRAIVVELTEHVPIDDYGDLRAAIATLGEDVRIAVDDAGAGFASMRHILELHPAFAKLDLSLVRGIDADDLRQALASGLNYFARRTDCRLIAEGVETEAEADTLRGLGIECGQGYLFGRPERIADLVLPTRRTPSAGG